MRGLFRIALMAGVAASMYTGYRAVSSRRTRNPAGLGDANRTRGERRRAAGRFRWLNRQRVDDTVEMDVPEQV
jgi:hypothetical protein